MFTLRSPAFAHDSPIPKRYTADGEALSPPLSWTEVPEGTRSFALVVDDPDAPDPANPKRTYVHWVVYNLPASCTELPADAARHLPQGAKHGRNDAGTTGYVPPDPPIGEHRYFFKLYALDCLLDLEQPTKQRLMKAMDGHILGKAEMFGRYSKVTAEVG